MAKVAPQIYEITLFDSDHEVMDQCHLPYPLAAGFDSTLINRADEREVHFRTLQQGAEADSYEARLMRPREAKKLHRKAMREAMINEFTSRAAKLIRLDEYIELIPVIAELEQPTYQSNGSLGHFARG